ncbi:transcriptional regulator TetR family [Photobacterium aphoticum]|nr:transcriptional regulator TetR family [Photobacterium aphoticum]
MSFISLMIFPFLIPPSMLQLQGIEMDETYLAELAEHNVKLLTHGLLKPKEEG